MHFNPEIGWGAILVALTIFGSVLWATFRIIAEISQWQARVEERLDNHDEWIQGHEACNERILKYMETNEAKLSGVCEDVAFLRGVAQGEKKGKVHLQDRYD